MNIIVINSDTYRRSNLTCYGGDWVRTPCLDRFAERASIFDRYYLASFPTIPNRTDDFTGRFHFIEGGWDPLDRQIPILSQTLTDAGYVTQLLCDTPHLINKGLFFDRGFEGAARLRGHEDDHYLTAANHAFELPCEPSKLRNPDWLKRHKANFLDRGDAEKNWSVARLMRMACTWLDNNWKADKFFLWVDAFDPHEPWDPPNDIVKSYDPGYEGEAVPLPLYGRCDYLSDTELNHSRALYAAEATLVDRWIGYLLDKIEELGLFEDTMIIFTTDHGFYLGEHGYIGKHTLNKKQPWPMYDDLVRIPLLVSFPGVSQKKIDQIVQPPDLMPTILDAAGVEIPETVQGESLVPLLNGATSPLREVAVSSNQLKPGGSRVTVTSKDYQLIYGHPCAPAELYRLGEEGIESGNIIKEDVSEAETLRDAALDFLRSMRTEEKRYECLMDIDGIREKKEVKQVAYR